MALTWLSKFASHETRRSSRHSRAQLAVEPLEVRKLLSCTITLPTSMNNYQLSVVEDGADKQVDIHVVKNAGQDPFVTVTNDNHVSFNQSVHQLTGLDVQVRYSDGNVSESSTSLTGAAYEADVLLTADGSGGYDITGTVNTAAATAYSPVYGSLRVDHPVADTAAPYSPVYGSLFGANGPSYRDVRQGALGDCWLLASLAEVAAREPSDIQNMFTDLGTYTEDGSKVELYNVRFFNEAGVPEYVTVDTELPSGGDYYDHPVNDVLWVALAEKAYAEANGAGIVTTQNVGSDSYAALDHGMASWSLGAITGKPAIDCNGMNPADIASAWTAGNLIVIGASKNYPSSPYIPGDHDYAVVGYDSSSSMPFTVFNPWGTDDSGWVPGREGEIYGLFNANATGLSQNFDSQSFGTGTAAGLDDHGNTMAPVIVAPEVAPPMPLVLTQVPDKARAALHHDLALDALQQHDFDLSWVA